MRTLLTLTVVASLTTAAHAQDNRVMVQGIGAAPCSRITNLYRTASPTKAVILDAMVNSWASGFMSSGNLARRVQGKDSRDLSAMLNVDAQTMNLTLRHWCQQHPDKKLMTAVMTLFASFPSNNDADADMVADEPR